MNDHMAAPSTLLTHTRERNGAHLFASAAHHWPETIVRALEQSHGARDYRCALQVNTPMQGRFKGFDSKHRKDTEPYKRDFALNLAQKCKKVGIDIIGLCDHNSVEYVDVVRKELTQEGIFVFPGFEIASTEGLHLLCLFDIDSPADELDHVLTELGLPPKDRWVTGRGLAPKQSPKSFPQILAIVQKNRHGICIAAHMDRENGLLFECAKTTRAQYFTDASLLAGQISGARRDLSAFERKIVTGELNHYRRQQKIALLNCLDVYNLKDLENPACSTLIKMSTPGIEALWQAFLDPDSRLALLTERDSEKPRPGRRNAQVELIALAWEGEASFLHGCGIHFNENLNCLIGGRGTGKSTVIESLRYVLDQPPLGEQARHTHENILREVIKSGTKISLLVRTNQPSPSYYLIERLYPGEPAIYDETGQRRKLHVFDLAPGIDILGQHEIAELANDAGKHASLINRYRAENASRQEANKHEVTQLLEVNRRSLTSTLNELHEIDDKLSQLPTLTEKLKLFEDKGIEEKLRTHTLLTKEEQTLGAGRDHVVVLQRILEQARQRLELEPLSLPAEARDQLPNADLIESIQLTLENLQDTLGEHLAQMDSAIARARKELLDIAEKWHARKHARQKEYERALTDLQKEEIDGSAFLRLRREIEQLEPLRLKREQLQQKRLQLERRRKNLLHKRDTHNKNLFVLDKKAADKANHLLDQRVRVTLERGANYSAFVEKLKSLKLSLRTDFLEQMCNAENFSLANFVNHVRNGQHALQEHYKFSKKQAEGLAHLNEATLLEIEELDPPDVVNIELNVNYPHAPANWRSMNELSTGQKATAILLLLFPESHTPLIIDQPEDDLDNRFIADTIIPTLRQAKRQRQFLFATHNANLPVLGDAELIIALDAGGEGNAMRAQIHETHVGSIDRESVKLLVEQVLEGGQRAFEMRRAKYGF